MRRSEVHVTSTRGQLAATILVALGALTGLGLTRLAPGDVVAPPEIELLLGFVFLGGLCLAALDLFRHGVATESADSAPSEPRPAVFRAATPPRPTEVLDTVGSSHQEDTAALAGSSAGNPFLEAIIERASAGLVACDPHGKLTIFNRTARELHGVPDSVSLESDFGAYYELYAGDGVTRLDPRNFPLARALRGEALTNEEIMIASRNG